MVFTKMGPFDDKCGSRLDNRRRVRGDAAADRGGKACLGGSTSEGPRPGSKGISAAGDGGLVMGQLARWVCLVGGYARQEALILSGPDTRLQTTRGLPARVDQKGRKTCPMRPR
jgi:hypothetical protein